MRDSICQDLSNPSWNYLPGQVKHQATLAIVNEASIETKPYYEKGKWWNNGKEENWVAWWYFHVSFRYKSVHPTSMETLVALTQLIETTGGLD